MDQPHTLISAAPHWSCSCALTQAAESLNCSITQVPRHRVQYLLENPPYWEDSKATEIHAAGLFSAC